ncbi:MAG: hypothetical protein ACXW31_08740 [Thermoanaerobaculia bacterium]
MKVMRAAATAAAPKKTRATAKKAKAAKTDQRTRLLTSRHAAELRQVRQHLDQFEFGPLFIQELVT